MEEKYGLPRLGRKISPLLYVNIYAMKRTTLYVEEDMDLTYSHMAKRFKKSKAELMREALEKYASDLAKKGLRPLPRSIGMGRSGTSDLAQQDEELLAKMYQDKAAKWGFESKK